MGRSGGRNKISKSNSMTRTRSSAARVSARERITRHNVAFDETNRAIDKFYKKNQITKKKKIEVDGKKVKVKISTNKDGSVTKINYKILGSRAYRRNLNHKGKKTVVDINSYYGDQDWHNVEVEEESIAVVLVKTKDKETGEEIINIGQEYDGELHSEFRTVEKEEVEAAGGVEAWLEKAMKEDIREDLKDRKKWAKKQKRAREKYGD